jgi:type II secretory pathway predicted ATPase ExeA/pSer/pThr/pTyr-binding forkhead associated (FHA) protein
MQLALAVRKGPARGQTFPLSDQALTLIGRASSNHVVLLHHDVSGNHCILAPSGADATFEVVDARSRNGTRINGSRVKRGTLATGDAISIGPFELELVEAVGDLPEPRADRPCREGPIRFKIEPERGRGRAVALLPGSATVAGRSRYAHLRVHDEYASEIHCLMALDPARPQRMPFVTDLRTSNGTYVKGKKIGRKHLSPGDRLTIGETHFRLTETTGEERTAPKKAPSPSVPARGGEERRPGAQPQDVQERSTVPVEEAEPGDLPVLHFPDEESAATPEAESAEAAPAPALVPDAPEEPEFIDPEEHDLGQGDEILDLLDALHSTESPAGGPSEAAGAVEEPEEEVAGVAAEGLEMVGALDRSEVGYKAFFGLSAEPFQLSADPDFFFPSPHHTEALEELSAWLTGGPPVAALYGPRGVGKTLLVSCLARRLASQHPAPVVIRPFRGSTRPERLVVGAAARANELVGIQTSASDAPLDAWSTVVAELESRGVPLVFLIDDAHHMPREDRRGLAQLLDTDGAADVVRTLLVGAPELADQVRAEPLDEFVGPRIALGPLDQEEVPDYVGHRLRAASGRPDSIFSREALRLVGEHSRGVPRDINRIANAALSTACCESRREVDAKTAERAIRSVLGPAARLSSDQGASE